MAAKKKKKPDTLHSLRKRIKELEANEMDLQIKVKEQSDEIRMIEKNLDRTSSEKTSLETRLDHLHERFQTIKDLVEAECITNHSFVPDLSKLPEEHRRNILNAVPIYEDSHYQARQPVDSRESKFIHHIHHLLKDYCFNGPVRGDCEDYYEEPVLKSNRRTRLGY